MRREVVPPAIDEHDEEVHPAFGLIGATRTQTSRPGSTLFDSDIQHSHTVNIRIATASRKRELAHDWLHRKQEFVEVELSEAQWASFVSSMNSGTGVACTIRRREDDYFVPGLPYEPRLAESLGEVRDAGDRALEKIREAFDVVFEKPTKANLRHLKAMIDNAPSNMEYTARALSEHAENVVQKSRADLEAMVVTHAQRLGLNPADMTGVPQIGTGEDD